MPPKFFGPSWTGKSIAFEQPQSSSRKIVEKQDEKVHQLGSSDLNGLLGGSHISYAYARFICEDEQSGSRAFLRIYMQIPHAETMFEPVEVRAAQAKKIFHGEATAYLHFNKNGAICPSRWDTSPRFNPGRATWSLADGHGYWALEPSERDDIITAFKQAYAELFRLGFVPVFNGPEHMLWEKENKTIYIIGFSQVDKVTEADGMSDDVLDDWDLLKPPSYVTKCPPPSKTPHPTYPQIGQFR